MIKEVLIAKFKSIAYSKIITIWILHSLYYSIAFGQTSVNPVLELNASGCSNQNDVCIWVHPTDKSLSTVIATDRVVNRIFVYDMQGSVLQNININGYQPGNIDVRYNFLLAGVPTDIVGYNCRNGTTVIFYKVNPLTRLLSSAGSFTSGNNYGFCLYESHLTSNYYAFTSTISGNIRQYELYDNAGNIGGIFIREFNNGVGATEGMVCDDENGILFAGNENLGVYRFEAEPTNGVIIVLDAETGDESGWNRFDIDPGNSFQAVPEAKLHGNYGYKILFGSNRNICERYYVTSNFSEAYFRYYYYIPGSWSSNASQVFMGGIEGDQSGNLLVGLVYMVSSGKITSFRICSETLGSVDVTNPEYWTADTWHSIEFHYKRGTGDGGIQCWIDNDLVLNDMDNNIQYYANTFSIGPWWNWGGGFSIGSYVYVDEAVVSRNPIGESSNIMMRELVAGTGTNGFSSDVKGLTLYYLPNEEGYLIASSQGNNRFYVFDRKFPHSYIKYFTVAESSLSEGIDVCNLDLGGIFSQGIFLCHNGGESPGVIKASQWEDIGLEINTSYWALPVELVYFTGRITGNKIILEWKTETEVSNYGFEVEKNINSQWETIGFLSGHGNSNSPHFYEFIDENILINNVYRLKQIDTDGEYEYFEEIEITGTVDGYQLSNNYPNPFNSNTIFEYSIPLDGLVTIQIFNTLSERISEYKFNVFAGNHKFQLNSDNLASGNYIGLFYLNDIVLTKKFTVLK